jgi:transposase
MTKMDGRTLDHKTLEHLRIIAVKRVVEGKETPSVVMQSLGLCRTTMYPWLREFKQGGLEALAESIAQGPEPKLNEKQRQQVRRWILGKDPRQYGFDFALWTRRIVQALVKQKLGIDLGLTAVGRLLASLEITPQKPLRRAYERDPKAVALWEQETYPQLKRRARRLGAMIFFLDEAGFQSNPPLRRTYGLKGHTPVVTTSGQRQSLNVISAVNARGHFWAATYEGKLDAESFVLFLGNFMKVNPGSGEGKSGVRSFDSRFCFTTSGPEASVVRSKFSILSRFPHHARAQRRRGECSTTLELGSLEMGSHPHIQHFVGLFQPSNPLSGNGVTSEWQLVKLIDFDTLWDDTDCPSNTDSDLDFCPFFGG